MSETKMCAVCGERYDADYDACPACSKGRERTKAIIAGVVTLLILFGCTFCAVPGLYNAFIAGLTGG